MGFMRKLVFSVKFSCKEQPTIVFSPPSESLPGLVESSIGIQPSRRLWEPDYEAQGKSGPVHHEQSASDPILSSDIEAHHQESPYVAHKRREEGIDLLIRFWNKFHKIHKQN